jgi:hypothetical protein
LITSSDLAGILGTDRLVRSLDLIKLLKKPTFFFWVLLLPLHSTIVK